MYTIRATYIPCENMFFDRDYYISRHMPLAEKHLAGKVSYKYMHAEFDMELLMDVGEPLSPCVYVLHVQTKKDVDDFRDFMNSAFVEPLRDDVKNYTNCKSEWSVAEIVES
jgi:hypothetical protein